MKYSKMAWGLVALTAGLGLGACGGSGGSAGTGAAANKSVTVGVISGFGSIYVNGCEYETDTADIYIEGVKGTEDDLSVGDVVQVSGPANCTHADATAIKFANELEGVVDSNSVTAGTGTMVVMGQDVTVNELTTYEDYTGSVATVNDVTTGHIVEVSGFGIGTGEIVASRIEVKALNLAAYSDDIEVKGVVSSHNGTDQFNIGNLVVDYGSHPAYLDGISQISEGLYVEVKAATYTAGSMNLVATKVELEDDGEIGHQGEDDEEFEIKGMLTAAYDSNTKTFGINDQMVLVNNSTEFEEEDEGMAPLMTLISDSNQLGKLYLEVEGNFNASGVLVAEEVELEDDDVNDDSEVTGMITSLASSGGNNNGTLTVSGITLTVTNDTIMEDDSSNPVAKFNFTHLGNGDLVEVYYDATTLVAIKVERK